jgi:hypothetical protein
VPLRQSKLVEAVDVMLSDKGNRLLRFLVFVSPGGEIKLPRQASCKMFMCLVCCGNLPAGIVVAMRRSLVETQTDMMLCLVRAAARRLNALRAVVSQEVLHVNDE